MKDYQYYLELIIAGAGALFWVLLLSIDVFGASWFYIEFAAVREMGEGMIFAFIIVLFPFVFVSGIIMDRISDYLFDKMINIKISKKYFESKYEYQKAKSLIFYKSTNLKGLYEYGRMRLRVCRSWTINSLLILVTSNYLIWKGSVSMTVEMQIRTSSFISILLFGSTMVSFLTWRNLTKKEYRFVKMEEQILKEICD